jgi:hypothetical protein
VIRSEIRPDRHPQKSLALQTPWDPQVRTRYSILYELELRARQNQVAQKTMTPLSSCRRHNCQQHRQIPDPMIRSHRHYRKAGAQRAMGQL